MPRLGLLALLPALLVVSACGDRSAPTALPEEVASADALADAMLQRYETNLGGVEAFTVIGGGAQARYTLSGDTTGLDRFSPPEVGPVGDGSAATEASQLLNVQVPNVPRMARGLRTADFSGPLTRDGRRAYVLTTTDPGALFGEPGTVPADTSETREFRVYVDAQDYDVLEIYQVVALDSLQNAVTSRILYSNFQETDGVTLPHTIRQIDTGLDATMDETQKMLIGGQIGMARNQASMMPDSPEKEARLAALDAQQRALTEGVREVILEVESVRVGPETEE